MLDGLERLDEDGLSAGACAVNYALDAALLLNFYRDDETFAADGDELILHRAAFREAAQVSAQGFLNGAALLFHFAADAGEFGRGFVFEGSVGLDFVAETAEEFCEVGDAVREFVDLTPFGSHGGRWMLGDLAPFGGAVDYQDYVADLGGFQSDAGDAGLFDEVSDVDEAGKVEASSDAAEFTDFGGELLLGLDPSRRRSEGVRLAMRVWPRGEGAYSRSRSRSDSNSRTREEV